MDMYGVSALQGALRMRFARRAHGGWLLAHAALAAAARRGVAHHWFRATFRAQKSLQAVARLRAAPARELHFARLPARALAVFLQARLRRALVRKEAERRYIATLVLQVQAPPTPREPPPPKAGGPRPGRAPRVTPERRAPCRRSCVAPTRACASSGAGPGGAASRAAAARRERAARCSAR
jgi:hypothetical protein